MLHIGVRAHDFGTHEAADLAALIAPTGATCIQLALSKALPAKAKLPAELGPDGTEQVRKAFADRGISVAILGSYINPVHPDPAARNAQLARFEAHLAAAASFGCSIVGTETGSRNPDCSFHPETATEETFRDMVASLRRLAATAERIGGVYVGVEAVADQHTIASAALMKRLLQEVDSPAIGVIFDPVNLVPRLGILSMDAFLDECFDAFGDRIVAVHAKDYQIEEGCCGPVKSDCIPVLTGEMDWRGVFRRLRKAGKENVPILIEDIAPSEAAAAVERIRSAWAEA